MNSKQKYLYAFMFFTGMATLVSSMVYSPTAYAAVSKNQFVNILCKGLQGPPSSKQYKTFEEECKAEGKKSNQVALGNKTYKYSAWKNQKPKDLREAKAAGVVTPKKLKEHRENKKNENKKDGIPNPIEGEGCGGVKTSIIKCAQTGDSETDVTQNGVWGLLLIVLNIMVAGVGVVAVGGIVYGAVLYTTAEDKADQVKKATEIITNVVIGLIAFAFMYSALNFLIPGGVFN